MKLFFVILSVVVFTTDALGYPPLDAPMLEAFIDGSVKTAMKDQHLPGVTVSVVQNGQLVNVLGFRYLGA